MTTKCIETKSLDVGYDKRMIIEGLDITIPKRRITSIVGPNGCGKSTLLKGIGRILKTSGGSILLDGHEIRSMSTLQIAQKMAILPQSPKAPSGLTVGELVSYGRFPHKKGFGTLTKEDKGIVEWALDATGMTEFEITDVDTLSGGQRQRAWIAMAIAQKAEIILLDEPTTYLDMTYQLEVLDLLMRLNKEQGCSIVMVLHDLNLAARFSDFLLAIRKGAIVAQGTPAEIMTPEVLRDTFEIDAEVVTDQRTMRPACLSYHLIQEKQL